MQKHAPNFREMLIDTEIGHGGIRKDPAYVLTRDGFTLLAMGFTGKRALQFKLAYIDAFNRMEQRLQSPAQTSVLPDADAMKLALQAASEAASAVQSAVFEALLDNVDFNTERWMLSFRMADRSNRCVPSVQPIEHNAFVAPLARVPQIIDERVLVDEALLLSIMTSCMRRLEWDARQRAGAKNTGSTPERRPALSL